MRQAAGSGKCDCWLFRLFLIALASQLESYIETTGHQLAEAMTVSFSTVLGPRLREEPYKTTGEQGVHSTIQEMIAKGTRDEQEMEKHVGSWGSSWLLKAAAGDKPGAGMGGKAAHLEQMQKIMQAANGGTVDLSGAGGEASTEQEDLELARRNEDL